MDLLLSFKMYMSNFYPAILSIATYTSYVASATIPTYSNSTINWFQCQQNGTWPFTCGTLAVPLDYTDSSSRKFDLQLLRIDATKQPKKGSILFNPGGPGGGTREFLAGFGKELLVATGGYFDLIAFDTRGVGTTLPFSCFDATTRATVNALYATKTLNSSDTALGEIWSVYTAISELCYDANKDIGEFLGTAFIARDMIQIVDALNEDGKLRFYGFSYGTILGATVAAMFPDRIDKMILDGVVNTEEWYAAR